METTEEIVRKFLDLSPSEIAESDALRDWLESHYEYDSLSKDTSFSLAMKIIYANYS